MESINICVMWVLAIVLAVSDCSIDFGANSVWCVKYAAINSHVRHSICILHFVDSGLEFHICFFVLFLFLFRLDKFCAWVSGPHILCKIQHIPLYMLAEQRWEKLRNSWKISQNRRRLWECAIVRKVQWKLLEKVNILFSHFVVFNDDWTTLLQSIFNEMHVDHFPIHLYCIRKTFTIRSSRWTTR